jgi:O-antigen ligase
VAKDVVSSEARERPGIAEYGFWFFLAVAVGRVNQLIPGLSSLPLAKLSILVAGAAFFMDKKRTLPALSADGHKILRAGLGVICLAVVLTPGSIWPGASVNFVIFGLPPLIAAAMLACSMRRSWQSMRGTLLALLLCGFVLGTLAAIHSHGRAEDSSTDYDPNDLAYVLVTVVPLGLGFLTISKARIPKIVFGFMTAICVVAMLLTGSRGGLLGFLTILLLLVFVPLGVGEPSKRIRSLRSSVAVLIVIAGAGMAVWTQLPSSMQDRYMTLLHLNSDYNTNLSDKTGRGSVWARGLQAFVARPIGYGPHTYEMVDLRFGGTFKAPHNSYLEALVELGPLGLWFLLRMYLMTLRALQGTRSTMLAKPGPTVDQIERAILARGLQYGVIANMVAGFFLSDTYSMLPWTMFGLAAAISALPANEPARPERPERPLRKPRVPERSTVYEGTPRAATRLGRALRAGRRVRPKTGGDS